MLLKLINKLREKTNFIFDRKMESTPDASEEDPRIGVTKSIHGQEKLTADIMEAVGKEETVAEIYQSQKDIEAAEEAERQRVLMAKSQERYKNLCENKWKVAYNEKQWEVWHRKHYLPFLKKQEEMKETAVARAEHLKESEKIKETMVAEARRTEEEREAETKRVEEEAETRKEEVKEKTVAELQKEKEAEGVKEAVKPFMGIPANLDKTKYQQPKDYREEFNKAFSLNITVRDVKTFQELDSGLKVDGALGPKTLDKLLNAIT